MRYSKSESKKTDDEDIRMNDKSNDTVDLIASDDEVFNGGFCWYEKIREGVFKCASCGRVVESKARDPIFIVHPCQSPKTRKQILRDNSIQIPNIVRRLGNFGIAYLKHRMLGSQECTQEEIDTRYAFCNSPGIFLSSTVPTCIYFRDGVCAACGCNVNRKLAIEGLNKLSWKESKCPKNFW